MPADGDYAVTCAGPAKVFTGADVEKLGGSTIMALLFGVLGSLAVGLLGLVLTIVGIVKLVRSGRERARRGGGGYGCSNPGPYAGAPAPARLWRTPAALVRRFPAAASVWCFPTAASVWRCTPRPRLQQSDAAP